VTQATEVTVQEGSPLSVANPAFHSLRVTRGGNQVSYLKEFFNDEQGAELAEYAVGTAILVAVAIIVYKVLGDAVNVKMSSVANEVQK
jgi:Flp pilus assembly pilin Flp